MLEPTEGCWSTLPYIRVEVDLGAALRGLRTPGCATLDDAPGDATLRVPFGTEDSIENRFMAGYRALVLPAWAGCEPE